MVLANTPPTSVGLGSKQQQPALYILLPNCIKTENRQSQAETEMQTNKQLSSTLRPLQLGLVQSNSQPCISYVPYCIKTSQAETEIQTNKQLSSTLRPLQSSLVQSNSQPLCLTLINKEILQKTNRQKHQPKTSLGSKQQGVNQI